MIKKSTTIGTFEHSSLELDIDMEITVEISYIDDSGTYYDNNGEGVPSSLDWYYKIVSIYDISNEKWLDEKKIIIDKEDIYDDVEEILCESLNNENNYYDNLF